MSEDLLARWMDDREGLSEEDAADLQRILESDPDLARQAKDQLALDDLLSRRLAVDRRAFESQVAQRIAGARTDGTFVQSTLEAVREPRRRPLRWRARLPEVAAAAVLIAGLLLLLRRDLPTPMSEPAARAAPHGLRAQYYRGRELNGPSVDRIDPTIDYQWAAGGAPIAAAGDVYSIRWTGRLTPRVSGRTTFHARYDDGVRIWVGGKLVLDDWNGRYVIVDRSADVDLIAGTPVDLKVEYFNGGDRGVIQLFWSSPGRPEEILPVSALSHE